MAPPSDIELPPTRIDAGDHAIDVWLAFYDEFDDSQLLARLRDLLDDDERRRQQRFHFADDRTRYLVTRAMLRTVLSRYAPITPADWTFTANAYGRPEIANPHDGVRGLTFNISHTRGLIALGVTRHRALGIDVEHVSARPVPIDIAAHHFAPAEVDALSRVPPERQQHRFFEYWTFKEAYIKARGMGLAIPLDRFAFHYPHEHTVRIAIEPDLHDDPDRWSFWQCRPAPDHLLAICAERVEKTTPRVTFRKLAPGFADVSIEPEITLRSE